MPPRDVRALLLVAECCESIRGLTADLELDAYRDSRPVRSAVEREFITIGEAASRLAKSHPDVAARLPNLSNMIVLRHLLVHGYERVDEQIVWNIARVHVDGLASVARLLIAEHTP